MDILKIILRITGLTQGELADYVGVSRASINTWLKDDSNMSLSSQYLISNKFGFPVSFFGHSSDNTLDDYKLIYRTIFDSWNNKENDNDKFDNMINTIESDDDLLEKLVTYAQTHHRLEDESILHYLSEGRDPFTLKPFDNNHILNNPYVNDILKRVYKEFRNGKIGFSVDELDDNQLDLYHKLCNWRIDVSKKEKVKQDDILDNRVLLNIIKEDVNSLNDLLHVRGFKKKYALEVYEIIKDNQIYNDVSDLIKDNKYGYSLNTDIKPLCTNDLNSDDLPF